MQTNVGGADQAIRVVIGVALLLSILLIDGAWRWLGLVGLIPLLTGLARWCPLYTLFGIKTCPKETSHV
jgi:hypothetical protein